MQINNKKKICVVVSSLADGGAERSSAILTQMLSSLGHDVHVVSVLPNVDYEFSGKLLNLGKLKEKSDSVIGRINRFRVFSKYIKINNFDFIIENRSRNSFFREIVLTKFIYNPKKTIYCVRSYNLSNYFINPKWASKYLYRDAFAIVANSKVTSEKVRNTYKFDHVRTIYNAIEPNVKSKTVKRENFILFYGRIIDEVKNLSLLIKSYKLSRLRITNVRLKILGSGKDEYMLQDMLEQAGLADFVEILSFDPNPEKYIQNALFTVLTSRYEGFPRVLIESLALGTPVVSVDCKSGPSEIINHKKNGLLVPNHNIEALADAMNSMVEDEDLYLRCRKNAEKSVERFSMTNIAVDWQNLLNQNYNKIEG